MSNAWPMVLGVKIYYVQVSKFIFFVEVFQTALAL